MADPNYIKEEVEGDIIIYRLCNTRQECIDAWFEDVSGVFRQAHDEDRPVYLLYDVQTITIPTSYGIRRAQELSDLPLPPKWRVATVVGSDFATSIVNLIRSVSLLSLELYARSRVFASEEDALAWLREEQEKLGQD
ncbi:MAG: hypothetical protein ACLFU8_14925 [Anaerolineales bacterium]